MTIAALIVAAGRGSRAGPAAGAPKQYALLAGEAMLTHTLRAFVGHPAIDIVKVVIHPDDHQHYAVAAAPLGKRIPGAPVHGGATRQESVRLGLEALGAGDAPPASVLIHDAARPLVEPVVISRVVDALAAHAGAIAADPVADTLKRARPDSTIAETVDRASLWRAQTPQGFRFAPILAAHRRAEAEGRSDFTDDAAIAEWAGLDVALVMGSPDNIKVTGPGDLALAARLMGARGATLEPRTGTGFDVHRFGPGDHVWLGGVRIAHHAGLIGHSDADAPLHALTDAILGALSEGDIGDHFPPSDPQWKGAPSRLFVVDAARRVAARGGRIANVDLTILAEAPRIAPHRDAMRAAIADMLGIDVARVAVKATTTEGLGFLGRGEGLAAMASATILLPA